MDFWIGFCIGSFALGGFWWATSLTYKTTLLMCANQQTAEKIGDGFYYIVPEHEYVKMVMAANAAALAEGEK